MAKEDIKQIIKEPDEFITFTDKAVKWAQANTKKLVIGLTATVLVVGGAIGLQSYAAYRKAQAMANLGQVMMVYEKYLSGQITGETVKTMQEALVLVADEFSATPAGAQARLVLGQVLYREGRYDEAAQQLEALSQGGELADELMPLALHGLGQSLEAQKKYDDALKAYLRAEQAAGKSLAGLYQLDRARVMAANGQGPAAAELYQKALAANPDPFSKEIIVAALADLGQAAAPAKPAAPEQAKP